MAFWDNLGQRASVTTAKAMQKAKEISDVAKFNSLISDEETKINNTYYQIGKLYAEMYPNYNEQEFTGMIAAIGEADEKIKSYRQQIQDIKGVIRCSKCGAEVPSGISFCSSCGAALPKVQNINTDDMVRCEGCSTMVKKGARFCTACGKPMAETVMPVSEKEDISVAEQEVQEKICPNCGKKMEMDKEFCTECGTKL